MVLNIFYMKKPISIGICCKWVHRDNCISDWNIIHVCDNSGNRSCDRGINRGRIGAAIGNIIFFHVLKTMINVIMIWKYLILYDDEWDNKRG